MNMKKLLALLLAVVMVFGIVACTPADPTNPGTNPTDPTDPKNPTNPTDPTDPKNPTNPTDPVVDPTDPTDPTEPEFVWNGDSYSTYYQTFQSEDQGTANYWDDKGSVAGDLHSYFAGGFWGTAMNEEKDGYDWICELAKEKPVAQNPDENGLATIYKFEVKVGSELVYNTMSTDPVLSAYKGREVQLEDYLTAWKELYCQANAIARGPEGAKVGAGSIKGIEAYYNATAEGFNQEAWDQVGIKATMEDGKAYLTFEFDLPTNSFYAMYYLASGLYCPIPAEFLEEIGGLKNYATFNEEKGWSPVDTSLSTAYYMLESWQYGKEIVFKKNDLYEDGGRYQIPGIYMSVMPAVNSDPEAALKEFLAGHLDAVSIPSTKLDEYKNDPRATTTLDSTTFKLNMNTCDAEQWEALFGENGSIVQTPKENYWALKPAMSNDNFLKGLNYSINRKEFASILGKTPSNNYFGSSYLSDPENGVAYNSTQAHADAVASQLANTDGYGYSLTLAQQYFKAAADEMIANGSYKAGDTIVIEICWMDTASIEQMGNYIEKYMEDAFNSCGSDLKLDVQHYACAVWSDVYYAKMMVGQFDIGFGSISGNTLNPLNFMEVLRSDNTSGFTLNWGVDTSVVTDDIFYDGRAWSFNTLWQAADQGILLDSNGALYGATLNSITDNEDGTRTVKINVGEVALNGVSSAVAKIVVFGYNDTTAGSDYQEEPVEFTIENGVATCVLTAEQVAKYDVYTAVYGYDVFFNVDAGGAVSQNYISLDHFGEQSAEPIVVATEGQWFTYVAASYEERTVILGILEKWAVDNFLTGLTIYGNGGYVMYDERVNPGTGDWTNYIPGYGFGVLAHGDLLG